MTSAHSPEPEQEVEQPFVAHLIELRDRLLRVVIAVILVFVALAPFANWLFTRLAGPLMAHLPEGSSLVAIDVASPFFTPFKLAMVAAVFIAMPYILYQLWAFVAPGLYQHERQRVVPLLVSSTLLFYLGAAFAYFVVFPLIFAFLTQAAPQGVEVMTDISRYLDFVLTLFFAFGVAFEVPVATVLLVWSGAVTPDTLRQKRPYIIVAAFVIGMLLTPPDIISQTLLALPMWLLFEIGVFMSERFKPGPERSHEEYEPPAAEPMSEEEMERELDRYENDEK
ncbi:MAG TPA: twin-arginine translocase subunit TatC [Gammaproteobacteria bacterium]|nr:twin-arginine translocase subunit TatC [Gammaproteobacteria bacterium]